MQSKPYRWIEGLVFISLVRLVINLTLSATQASADRVRIKYSGPWGEFYEFLEEAKGTTMMPYVWSGSLEQGDTKGARCLRESKIPDPVTGIRTVVLDKCTCIGGCDNRGLNHPVPELQWDFLGVAFWHEEEPKKDTSLQPFWAGTISSSNTGRCLTYTPLENPMLDKPPKLSPIGTVTMQQCLMGDPTQSWVVWLRDGGQFTRILPAYHTHMIEECFEPKGTFRGLVVHQPASQGDFQPEDIYFGCSSDINTRWMPHPEFLKVPEDSVFAVDKYRDYRTEILSTTRDFANYLLED
ncbi:hypothetical protein ABW19_dt0209192 [Dactylella cylindrospora]|nr:hypothetical protein ABW19_dt0209192 [Dactylella cylindrospora]